MKTLEQIIQAAHERGDIVSLMMSAVPKGYQASLNYGEKSYHVHTHKDPASALAYVLEPDLDTRMEIASKGLQSSSFPKESFEIDDLLS